MFPITRTRPTYIDLARGSSAFAVLLVHYRWFYDPPLWGPGTAVEMPLHQLLWPFYDYGGVAVQIFWLLSGVVFAVSYGMDTRPFNWQKFAVWRFSRLYPLHFMTLLLVIIIQALAQFTVGHEQVYIGNNDLYHFILQLFLAANWGFQNGDSFNAPIWSVSVEILIYAVFALYMLFYFGNLMVAAAIAVTFGIVLYTFNSAIAFCGLFFFVGFLLAAGAAWLHTHAKFVSVAGLAALSVVIALIVFWWPALIGMRPLYYAILPLLVGGALLCDVFLPPVPKKFYWIGDITYATYLLHMPIIMAIKTLLQYFDQLGLVNHPLMLILYVCIVVTSSKATYSYFEMPVQNWLRERYRAKTRDGASVHEEQGALGKTSP